MAQVPPDPATGRIYVRQRGIGPLNPPQQQWNVIVRDTQVVDILPADESVEELEAWLGRPQARLINPGEVLAVTGVTTL